MHPFHPSISVVIRTIGRPCIARALASLAAQEYRDFETVIVMARPAPPPDMSPFNFDWCVVATGRTLDRPSAANTGLDHSKGDFVVFLDDDDEFDARHLRTLVECLAANPGARLAYSATRILGENDETLGSIAIPFDRLVLHGQNFIQIGAALFDRGLVGEGLRFDPGMHLFQDWDFWIQASTRTSFVYTGLDTNWWRAHSGGSGAGLGSNLDTQLTDTYRRRLLAKWARVRGRLVTRVDDLVRRVKQLRAEGLIAEAEARTQELRDLVSGSPLPGVATGAPRAVVRERRSQFA